MDLISAIRKEKVFLQPGISTEEIKKTYGLSSDQAYKAKMKEFSFRLLIMAFGMVGSRMPLKEIGRFMA